MTAEPTTAEPTTAAPRVPITDAAAELWARTGAVGFLRGRTTGEVSQGAHAVHTGNVLVEVPGPGELVMHGTPTPQLANLSGAVHGGCIAMVCDEAAGTAASSTDGRQRTVAEARICSPGSEKLLGTARGSFVLNRAFVAPVQDATPA